MRSSEEGAVEVRAERPVCCGGPFSSSSTADVEQTGRAACDRLFGVGSSNELLCPAAILVRRLGRDLDDMPEPSAH